MYHHLVNVFRGVVHISFTPVIADSVRENRPIMIECRRCNWSSNRCEALDFVFIHSIPYVHRTIRATSDKGAVDRMERYCVDRIAFVDIIGLLVSVTFEREVGPIFQSVEGSKAKI